MNEYYFGDWNQSEKQDMQVYTVMLNVLINYYKSEIKNWNAFDHTVDFLIDERRIEERNFMNSCREIEQKEF